MTTFTFESLSSSALLLLISPTSWWLLFNLMTEHAAGTPRGQSASIKARPLHTNQTASDDHENFKEL